MTLIWHIDNTKISHYEAAEVINLIGYMKYIYVKLCVFHGKKHTYLGMDFDLSSPGKVKFSMDSYAKKIVYSSSQHTFNTEGIQVLYHLLYMRDEESSKTPPLPQSRLACFIEHWYNCCQYNRKIGEIYSRQWTS